MIKPPVLIGSDEAGLMGPADSLPPIGKLDDTPVPERRDMTLCSCGVQSRRAGAVGVCERSAITR